MYHSKNNSDLFFIDRNMGELEINGSGVICSEDTDVWGDEGNWNEQYTTLDIYDGITEIRGGVIEYFPNVTELRLPKSLRCIEMTDVLRALLQTNHVSVCAPYGSYGNVFATENNLSFRPEHIILGWDIDREKNERTCLKLLFHDDGTREVLYDIFTSGISAGANGGASLYEPMPKEYVPGCSLSEFARMFPTVYYDQIMNNPEVKVFLEHDNSRGERV